MPEIKMDTTATIDDTTPPTSTPETSQAQLNQPTRRQFLKDLSLSGFGAALMAAVQTAPAPATLNALTVLGAAALASCGPAERRKLAAMVEFEQQMDAITAGGRPILENLEIRYGLDPDTFSPEQKNALTQGLLLVNIRRSEEEDDQKDTQIISRIITQTIWANIPDPIKKLLGPYEDLGQSQGKPNDRTAVQTFKNTAGVKLSLQFSLELTNECLVITLDMPSGYKLKGAIIHLMELLKTTLK